MGQNIEINQGETTIKFTSPTSGKVSFKALGIKEDLTTEGGFLRIVFDMDGIGEHQYFQVPTIEVSYSEKVADTLWQCEFNGETILEKTDHYGKSTVILLNRKTLADLEHHHENRLVLHAEFPQVVTLNLEESFINFFK